MEEQTIDIQANLEKIKKNQELIEKINAIEEELAKTREYIESNLEEE